MGYRVEVSQAVNDILLSYVDRFYDDNGSECALNLLQSYDDSIDSLAENPARGCKLEDLPDKYRAIVFWPHLWLIYLVSFETVYVDLIVDDRQNYGDLFKR